MAGALVRMGECYEKLGAADAATGIYDRIVRGYSDQREATTVARARLAVLAPTPSRTIEMIVRDVVG